MLINFRSLASGAKSFPKYSTKQNIDPNFRYLQVITTKNNSRPITIITQPIDRGIYFTDVPIEFKQDSYDVDDNFGYVWNLNGEELRSGDSINKNDYTFNHSFTSPGQKNIYLNVTDDRGLTNRDQFSIIVIENDVTSSYILSYIDEPQFGLSYGRTLGFDATGTYAINTDVVSGNFVVDCWNGFCPMTVEGCPSGVTCPIPVTNAPASRALSDYSLISFDWTFDNDVNDVFSAMGSSGAVFTKSFFQVGDHFASLTTQINPTSTTDVLFDVSYDIETCVYVTDDNQYFFPEGSLGQSYWKQSGDLSSSLLDCYRAEGVNRDGEVTQECCPIGYSCDQGGGICEFTGNVRCLDFTSEVDCTGNEAVATSEITDLLNEGFDLGCDFFNSFGETCAEFTACQCEWINSKCQAVSNHKVQDLTTTYPITIWDYNNLPSSISGDCGADGGAIPQTGKCNFDFTYEGNCNDGDEFVVRSWVAQWDGGASSVEPDYCEDGSDTILCGNVVKLGFFGMVQFMITLLSIALIYGCVLRRRKRI